jgi:hypothetical protein
MPVSTMATSAFTRSSMPLILATVEDAARAPIRRTPVGMYWDATSTTSSGMTAATSASARSALTWVALS